MKHFFDIDIAKRLGINSAILLENLYFWTKKNEANKKHYYDGKYWTYNSVGAFTKLFPYLTYDSIRYTLSHLEKGGYIITGNYNQLPMDKTKWYALTEKAYSMLENSQMDLGIFPNGDGNNTRAIPNNKQTNIKENPLPKVKGEQAPSSTNTSYSELFNAPENKDIKDALVKYVNVCKRRNIKFQYKTLERWAKILRDNAGNDSKLAMAMVEQSIDNGWKDIYPLKNTRKTAYVKKEAVSIPVSKEDKATREDGSYTVF